MIASAELLPFLDKLATSLHMHGYELRAWMSVLIVTGVAGMVGALVVGNRMAFFSDAMAHCAFAGVALGILITMILAPERRSEYEWVVPLVMVAIGIMVGLGIAFVREMTGLASDTVIGVFFAGAVGFGAMLLTALRSRPGGDPDRYLFGSPLFVADSDLLYLIVLAVLTIGVLLWRYNHLTLASFNTSLARSRRVALRFNNYLFILLLALIVNFSIAAVGILLINAMLIVPAAAAGILARNLRQLFWFTFAISLASGVIGLQASNHLVIHIAREELEFGPSGAIICTSVCMFFLAMLSTVLLRIIGLRR